MKYINYFFFNINKKLSLGIKKSSGRNFSGKICVNHKFTGNKNLYYNIDFYRRINCYGYVYKIIKSSKRTALIGGIIYQNGLFAYILLSDGLVVGNKIYSGFENKNTINNGDTLLLKNINLFSIINNIELYPIKGSIISRSAGTSSIITSINNDKKIASIKLNSGWNIWISFFCLATLGIVSNIQHKFDCLKKAGKSWSLGKRPKVRGVAMNPCDHPHGGGEGKKSPPSSQRSPWGWLTKGTPSLKKKYDKKKKKLYKEVKK